MPEEDLLYTLAEIAIAVAGFSGIVTALSSRNGRSAEQSALDFQILQGVLMASLLVVGFSVLPGALVHMGSGVRAAWRVSSSIFFLVAGAYFMWTTPRHVASYMSADLPVPWSLKFHIVLTGTVLLALAASAMSFLPQHAHIAGLLVYLYMAAYSFVRVFLSIGRKNSAAK